MIGLAEHAPVAVVPQPNGQPGDPPPRLKEPVHGAEVQGVGRSSHGGAPLLVETLGVFRNECRADDRRRSIDQAPRMPT